MHHSSLAQDAFDTEWPEAGPHGRRLSQDAGLQDNTDRGTEVRHDSSPAWISGSPRGLGGLPGLTVPKGLANVSAALLADAIEPAVPEVDGFP